MLSIYIVICSFMGNGDYSCDRGLTFDTIESCLEHRDMIVQIKQVEDAYCSWEADDIMED